MRLDVGLAARRFARGGALPLLLLAALVLLLSSGPACGATNDRDETAACLGDIDSYLASLGLDIGELPPKSEQGPATDDEQLIMTQIKSALEEAKKQIEPVLGCDRSATLELEPDSIYWPLVVGDCRPKKLLAVIDSLLAGMVECDQVSLDYLMIVAGYPLSSDEGAKRLINRVARRRIEICWQDFVATVSGQLDRKMGKMSRPVFGHLESIAEMWAKVRSEDYELAKKGRARAGSIAFDERKAEERAREEDLADLGAGPTAVDQAREQPEKFQARLKSLKEIEFADQKLWDFALTINRLASKPAKKSAAKKSCAELESFFASFFVEPCQELAERVRSIVALGDIYRRHISQTLGQALANEKRTNARLDYELQVYRVCKLGVASRAQISESLSKMC